MSHPYNDFDEVGSSITGTDGNILLKSGLDAESSTFLATDETNSFLTFSDAIKIKTVSGSTENIQIGTNQTIDSGSTNAIQIGNGSSAEGDGTFCIGALAQTEGLGTFALGGESKAKGLACISIGGQSGTLNYTQDLTVNIGLNAGGDANASDSIHIGHQSGKTSSISVTDRILIGKNAGLLNAETNSVCIGKDAGRSMASGNDNNICIGKEAGRDLTSANTFNVICIGENTGDNNARQCSINIGRRAGFSGAGRSSINIGELANASGGGHSSCIVLNAQLAGSLNAAGPNRFYVKPIRNETTLTGFSSLYYNPTTGEICYN